MTPTRTTRSMSKLADKKSTKTEYYDDTTLISGVTEKYEYLNEEYDSINNVIKTLGMQLEHANSVKLEMIKQHNDDFMEFERVCQENINLKTQLSKLKNEMDVTVTNYSKAITKLAEYEKEHSEFKNIYEYVSSLEKKLAKYEQTVKFYSNKQEELLLNNIQNDIKMTNEIARLNKLVGEKEAEYITLIESLKEKDSVIATFTGLGNSIPTTSRTLAKNSRLKQETVNIKNKSNSITKDNEATKKKKSARKEKEVYKKSIIPKTCDEITEHRNKKPINPSINKQLKTTNITASNIPVEPLITKAHTGKKSRVLNLSTQPSKKIIKNQIINKTDNKDHKSRSRNQVKQSKVLILTDENGKMSAGLLNDILPKTYQVTSITKTDAQLFGVCSNTKTILSCFDKNDYVIVMGGLHYSYLKNKYEKERTKHIIQNSVKELIDHTENTNLVICSIPYRLDINYHNFDIYEINKNINTIALTKKHVSFVPLADHLEEADYVARGSHLHIRGKRKFTVLIKDAILKNIKDQTSKNGLRRPTLEGRG